MTNETLTNSQRQAAFRAKKEAMADFNAAEVLRLTKENEELKGQLKRVLEASKRSKIQHVSNLSKLRGQLLKSLVKTV